MLFSSKGNLPREIVEEGVPPTRELPLKFRYTLPEDSQITIQLKDKDNVVQRILVPQGNRSAGENVEQWDGLDYEGKVLPAGQYTWEGIYHKPLTQKALFSPHDSGQPPWLTDDGTGGWGSDEGTPAAVAALDDGVLMSWNYDEAGSGVQRTDLNGHKQWGNQHCATYMATDGKRVFTAGDFGFDHSAGVAVLSAVDGHPLAYGNGTSNLMPPPGGTADNNAQSGVAYSDNAIYASFAERNLIAVYDANSGETKGTWPIDHPGQLAATADGGILAISMGKLVVIRAGVATTLADSHLDDPRGIAVGADGSVYVANGGALQNVSVFDKTGAYQRSIGKRGGRPAVGEYNPNGMLDPGGITVDKNGHLWVAERLDCPKRISVWNAQTGVFVNEFFGGCQYFGYSYIDPRKPNEIYCHNVLWDIDWANTTTKPVSTIWRDTTPNMMKPPGVSGYNEHPIFFTAKNGRQYCYGETGVISVLSARQGNEYKPYAAVICLFKGRDWFGNKAQFPVMDDATKFPNGWYFWQDLNNDQTIQDDELTLVPADITPAYAPPLLQQDGDLNLYVGDYVLKPMRSGTNGQPVYDLSARRISVIGRDKHANGYLDPDGNVFTRSTAMLAKWSPGRQKAVRFSWPDGLALCARPSRYRRRAASMA